MIVAYLSYWCCKWQDIWMTGISDPKPLTDPVTLIERAIRLLEEEERPTPGVTMALASIEAVRDFLLKQKN
jgi:hypothetical protein